MTCDFCKKPVLGNIAFELLEVVPGPSDGPVRKKACFPCLQKIAEKLMRPLEESSPD